MVRKEKLLLFSLILIILIQGVNAFQFGDWIRMSATKDIEISSLEKYNRHILNDSINIPDTRYCTDRDNGIYFYKQGTVTVKKYRIFFKDKFLNYTDSCLEKSNNLREYYCQKNKQKEIIKNCSNGCKDGACSQLTSLTKEHTIKFYVDPELIENLNSAKIFISKYVEDLNFVYSKTTNRIFVFNPEKDLIITNNISWDSFVTCTYCDYSPSEKFDILTIIKKRSPDYFYPPAGGNLMDGSSINGVYYWEKIYDPNNLLTSSELDQYGSQVLTMVHEIAHTYGVAIGEYYSLNYILDTTGIEPILDIDLAENYSYWRNKGEDYYKRDPMLGLFTDVWGSLDNQSDRKTLFSKAIFSPLSSAIINSGTYRTVPNLEQKSLPNMSDITIKVTDSKGNLISNANVKIFEIEAYSPFASKILVDDYTNEKGEIAFDWLALTPFESPFSAYHEVRLIKVYKTEYTSSVKYISVFDAQEVKVLQGKSKWIIEINISSKYIAPVSAPNDSNCVDTDNGLSYFIKGFVNVSDPTNPQGYEIEEDRCLGDYKTLMERFCQSGEAEGETYLCPNGCSDGRCVGANGDASVTNVNRCIETDSGIDIYTKGKATGPWLGDINGTINTKEDFCSESDSTVLQEYTCKPISKGSTITGLVQTGLQCPGGCKNGACIR